MATAAHDLVIKGGTCFDGLGSEGVVADVAVDGGVVVEIGSVKDRARRVIDASGMFVAPGFVDGHTHLDAQIFWDPYAGSVVSHGVTSAIMGNCGFTLAPGPASAADLILRSIERAEDMSRDAIGRGVPWSWSSFPEYMDAVASLPKALNVGAQIGHSALRAAVMGERAFYEAARDEDITEMERAVRDAVAAGCMGFSTSRSYNHITRSGEPVASRIASWAEVSRLVMAMAEAGAGMFQLAPERPQEDKAIADFQRRLRTLAAASGRPVTWMVGGQQHQLDTVEGVIADGGVAIGQVHVRRFENIFGFRTALPFDRLPSWCALRREPLERQKDLLRDRDIRGLLIREAEEADYGRVVGAEVRPPQYDLMTVIGEPGGVEASVAAMAKERRCSPVEVIIELAVSSDLKQLFRQPSVNIPPDVMLATLQHPNTVIAASDSGAHISQILDSNIPTYFLSHWVRSERAFTWAEGIHMLSGRPASVWGLEGRGSLRAGSCADILVFDPDRIGCGVPEVVNDLPDGGPRLAQGANGIHAVIVNGQEVLLNGRPTGVTPGTLLRVGSSKQR